MVSPRGLHKVSTFKASAKGGITQYYSIGEFQNKLAKLSTPNPNKSVQFFCCEGVNKSV
jgi:hypothetical protein